jgi:hypothetical protein
VAELATLLSLTRPSRPRQHPLCDLPRLRAVCLTKFVQHMLKPPQCVGQPLAPPLPRLPLALLGRHHGVVVHISEQLTDSQLHVTQGDLVAEPEVPLAVEVAMDETNAQLGDEGTQVRRGHALS